MLVEVEYEELDMVVVRLGRLSVRIRLDRTRLWTLRRMFEWCMTWRCALLVPLTISTVFILTTARVTMSLIQGTHGSYCVGCEAQLESNNIAPVATGVKTDSIASGKSTQDAAAPVGSAVSIQTLKSLNYTVVSTRF